MNDFRGGDKSQPQFPQNLSIGVRISYVTQQRYPRIKKTLQERELHHHQNVRLLCRRQQNKVVELSETFLNLEDEEFFKYLEIAKKTLSGTIGNNLLELHFASEEEEPGGKQQYLLGLRESGLKTRNY